MKNKSNSTITIEGTIFEVDIETQRLVEQANPANAISFIDQMTDHGTHYSMYYDLARKNEYDTSMGSYESEDWNGIKIPKLIDLDPQGMADRYGYTVEHLKGKTDFEVIVNQEDLSLRHQGVLPLIEICEDQLFIIELKKQQLRHLENDRITLSLKQFDLSGDGLKYIGFYNPEKREMVDIDPRLTEFPDNVVKIILPSEIGLDPVATAQMYGINERDLLRRYPMQKEMKAEVIPLSETNIPAMIQRNREQLQLEHQENAKRAKPFHRPRF
jgi:hypothetical protein